MGGSIGASSELTKGSKFWFLAPMREPLEAMTADGAAQESLALEDDEESRWLNAVVLYTHDMFAKQVEYLVKGEHRLSSYPFPVNNSMLWDLITSVKVPNLVIMEGYPDPNLIIQVVRCINKMWPMTKVRSLLLTLSLKSVSPSFSLSWPW